MCGGPPEHLGADCEEFLFFPAAATVPGAKPPGSLVGPQELGSKQAQFQVGTKRKHGSIHKAGRAVGSEARDACTAQRPAFGHTASGSCPRFWGAFFLGCGLNPLVAFYTLPTF